MAQTGTRQRFTKHQLKADAFTTAVFRAREWAEQNLRLVLMAAGGVVVVVLAVWAITSYMSGQEQAAARLYGEAGVELRSDNLSGAILNFQSIMDNHSGAKVAGLACFQLADAYFQQRRFDDARIYFQRYLDDYGDDPLLVASAWSGLGAIDEHAQDFGACFDKQMRASAVDPDGFMTAEYLRQAVRCAVAANDTTSALQAYQRIQQIDTDPRNVELVRQRLIEDGFLDPNQ
jgi:tetratricopeptide (TPR) repeat protein